METVLETDHAKFGGRFTYEILGAFANHGIQLRRAISIISAQNPVVDNRATPTTTANPTWRVFLGANDTYYAVFSPDNDVVNGKKPAFFGPDDPRWNALLVLGGKGATFGGSEGTTPVGPLYSTSPGDSQNAATIVLDRDLLERLANKRTIGATAVPFFARAMTWRGTSDIDMRDSHIANAGQFIAHRDNPMLVFIPSSATTGGCTCRIASGSPNTVVPLVLLFFGASMIVRKRAKERR